MIKFEWKDVSTDYVGQVALCVEDKQVVCVEKFKDADYCQVWAQDFQMIFLRMPLFEEISKAQDYINELLSGFCADFIKWRQVEGKKAT